jgi:hypothetical protein
MIYEVRLPGYLSPTLQPLDPKPLNPELMSCMRSRKINHVSASSMHHTLNLNSNTEPKI